MASRPRGPLGKFKRVFVSDVSPDSTTVYITTSILWSCWVVSLQSDQYPDRTLPSKLPIKSCGVAGIPRRSKSIVAQSRHTERVAKAV